jgi:hypothetical protein
LFLFRESFSSIKTVKLITVLIPQQTPSATATTLFCVWCIVWRTTLFCVPAAAATIATTTTRHPHHPTFLVHHHILFESTTATTMHHASAGVVIKIVKLIVISTATATHHPIKISGTTAAGGRGGGTMASAGAIAAAVPTGTEPIIDDPATGGFINVIITIIFAVIGHAQGRGIAGVLTPVIFVPAPFIG